MTKHVWWLDIGLVLFCVFIDQDEVGFTKELGEYSAILISRLVNNSYMYMTVIPLAFHSLA